MLVLSRKVGERIWIGEDISITVVRITGGGVRLGIEAPNEMPVVREELKLKLEQDQADVEVDILDNSSPQKSV
ncbi:MAG: carbon storage regulator CsrA [Mariniblastus sp.]